LLESGVARAPDQEIVSTNQNRFTYQAFAERVARLASGLASLGVDRGDTVAILDWDTHRYLECFFAASGEAFHQPSSPEAGWKRPRLALGAWSLELVGHAFRELARSAARLAFSITPAV